MQHHEPVSFQMFCYPYDTFTFKTKALPLVIAEGWLKLQYKWPIQFYFSLLWLLLATYFTIFHPYDTPTFKTKALRLASIEGRVKCLLLLY